MRRLSLLLSLVLLSAGCALFGGGATYDPSAQRAQAQAQMKANLENVRSQARTGDVNAVLSFAALLAGAQTSPESKAAYGEVDWTTMNGEAEALLDTIAASGDPNAELQAVATKAQLHFATGRGPDAVAGYQALHDRAPTFGSAHALMAMHVQAAIPMANAAAFCEKNRALAVGDDQTYVFIQSCAQLNPSGSLATSVPWAKKGDLELVARVEAKIQAEAAQRQAEADAQREREQAEREQAMAAAAASSSSSSSSSSGSAPAGPSSVSITLRNTCPSTVKLFFGDKPKFGSGTYSSLSSNTTTSMSFRPGDMIWIVDDSQNGISSTSVSSSGGTVEITKSCNGLTSR